MSTKTFELEYTRADNATATVGVIIVAAGSASRMGGINKILAPVVGLPVIWRTIFAFNSNPQIGDIVLVTREDMIADLEKIADEGGFNKVSDIVVGGASRQESVKLGFERLKVNKAIKTVLVHDGARPLVSCEVIDRVITATEEFSAAIPVVAVKDTVKRVGSLGRVEMTVDRADLCNVQTPQGFSVECFELALEKVGDDLSLFTDDSSLVEAAGITVYTVEGDYKNIKITTLEDMAVATAYLNFIEGELL